MDILEEKRAEYRDYIEEHMSNVMKAYDEIREIFKDEDFIKDDSLNSKLLANCLLHDGSKYSEEEFEPYRAYFHSVDDAEKNDPLTKANFEEAWKHHYTYNLHHWHHWKINSLEPNCDENYAEMPSIFLAEMIIDWTAMGYKFGNNAAEYYDRNKHKIFLNPVTRERLERLLSKIR